MLIDRDTLMPRMLVVPAMVVTVVEALARLDDAAARQQRSGEQGGSRE
jgi:hypothetical protein